LGGYKTLALWSAGGKSIVFHHPPDYENGPPFILDADGSKRRGLPPGEGLVEGGRPPGGPEKGEGGDTPRPRPRPPPGKPTRAAQRETSGVAPGPGRVGAERPVLVAGVTGLVPQRVRTQPLRQRRPQAGVGRLDQDRADVNAAVRHHSGVVAQEAARVVAVHH